LAAPAGTEGADALTPARTPTAPGFTTALAPALVPLEAAPGAIPAGAVARPMAFRETEAPVDGFARTYAVPGGRCGWPTWRAAFVACFVPRWRASAWASDAAHAASAKTART